MAWGKADAKEIIGMEPDELRASLDKVGALETQFATFAEGQTKTTETLNTLMQKFEEASKPKPKPDTGDADLAFLAAPDETLRNRLDPLSRQTTDNTIMLQHRTARELYPKDFEKRGTEIVQRMGKLSAQQQCDPQCWTAMVMMVRGEHAGDLEKDGATGNFTFLEPVSAGLRSAKPQDGLSNAEREMVRTLSPFGITPEKYANGKTRLDKARAARLGRFAEVTN